MPLFNKPDNGADGAIVLFDTASGETGTAQQVFQRNRMEPSSFHCELAAGDTVLLECKALFATAWAVLATFNASNPLVISVLLPFTHIRARRSVIGGAPHSKLWIELKGPDR